MTERSKIKKKLDKIFSEYIRRRPCDEFGYGNCFTCGVRKFWSECDAGHFQSRGKMSTRWEELNVQLQCKFCNAFRGGEQHLFGKNLDELYGEGTADDLVFESNQTRKFPIEELREMIETYNIKVEELKRQME